MHDLVLRPQRVLSLCSGAGGLDLGVHDALGRRARTVCYVEHEVTACEVLAARIADGALDDAPIWTDLHTIDARPWRGRVDGIIGGYPCQPFSVAGKQLGAADPRHLWPRISAIVRDVQPEWCFFENVRGHVRIGLREVRADLLSMGYEVHAGIFSAAEVGAPHQRERLFILAHRSCQRRQQDGGAPSGKEAGANAGHQPKHRGDRDLEYTARSQRSGSAGGGADIERWAASGSGAGDSDVAHATLGGQRERGESPGGHGQPDGRDFAMADPRVGQLPEPWRGAEGRDGAGPAGARVLGDAERRLAEQYEGGGAGPSDKERPGQAGGSEGPGDGLPVFPPGPGDATTWQRILRDRPDLAPAVEPPVRGVADGMAAGLDLSRTARLRITGNGVVPQCAALAFRTLWGQLADAGHTEREERANEG